jgi:tRNA threonylcarbamoyladenosine biosynthesis protein TsaB
MPRRGVNAQTRVRRVEASTGNPSTPVDARAGALGFDTATDDVAVAVTIGGQVVAERRVDARPGEYPRHATALMGEIEAAVEAAGGWRRIGLISVGIGPGSFTGLRIGVATARALAQGLALPVAGVVSLEALARGIGELDPARSRLAVIDARRREAFAALYGTEGGEEWPPFVAEPDELAERVATLAQPPLAAGDGSVRFRAQLEAAGAEVLPDTDPAHRIAARQVCLLGAGATPVRPEEIEPMYLRRPDAELWRERDPGSRPRS